MTRKSLPMSSELIGAAGGAGDRLREERERLGFTLSAFAQKLGVHRNTQTNYELGKRGFDQAYVTAVKALGVDVPYLLDGVRGEWLVRSETESDLALAVLEALGYAGGARESLDKVVDQLAQLHELAAGAAVPDTDKFRVAAETLVHASPLVSAGGALNTSLLAAVIEGVETASQDTGVLLTPVKKAQAISMLYRAFRSSGEVDQGTVKDAVALAGV